MNEKLTVDQLREIRAAMTWGDHAYGAKEADGDAQELIKYAMHRAARRLGIAAPDGTLDDFLDTVTMADLSAALEEHDVDPTQSGSTAT